MRIKEHISREFNTTLIILEGYKKYISKIQYHSNYIRSEQTIDVQKLINKIDESW